MLIFKWQKLALMAILCTLSNYTFSFSPQQEAKVIQPWTTLGESEFLVDVSFQIERCETDGPVYVLLDVFNEGGLQTAFGFSVTVTDNSSGNAEVYDLENLSVPFASIHTASCEGEEYNELKLQLPAAFNSADLTLSINFNE